MVNLEVNSSDISPDYLDAIAAQESNILPDAEINYSDDLIRWQLDTSHIVKEIYYRLKGYTWDEEKEKFVAPDENTKTKPLLNEHGIAYVMTCIKSLCHKDMNLTDFDDKHINDITYDVVYRNILPGIVSNWYLFGKPERYEIRMIRTIVETNIFAIVRRAYKGKDRQGLNTKVKVGETRIYRDTPEMKQQDKGWLKSLF